MKVHSVQNENIAGGMNELNQNFGLLGSSGISAGAFLKSPWVLDDAPDIQLTLFPTVSEPHLTYMNQPVNATPEYILQESNQMLFTVALLTPEARQWIRLNSTNPVGYAPEMVLPTNRTTYLTKHDKERLCWAIGKVRDIMKFAPLSELTGAETSPGSSIHGCSDGSDLIQWVSRLLGY